MNAPEWLARREGTLRAGLNGSIRLVTLNGHPLYRLFVTPAKAKFTCVVTQTTNGQRLDGGKPYATIDAAFAGGLDELRERLGW